jgi:hypothetical protein
LKDPCATRAPIACSLTPTELGDRETRWRTLVGTHLVRASRTSSGALLELHDADGSLAVAVRDLTRAEKQCCPFFEFSVTSESGTVRLEVGAPDEAQPFVDALLQFAGCAPPHREQSGD